MLQISQNNCCKLSLGKSAPWNRLLTQSSVWKQLNLRESSSLPLANWVPRGELCILDPHTKKGMCVRSRALSDALDQACLLPAAVFPHAGQLVNW